MFPFCQVFTSQFPIEIETWQLRSYWLPHARGPAASIIKPGGVIHPFWELVKTTSISQGSISSGMQPSELTASTTISVSGSARRRSCKRSRSFVTPVDVSLCRHKHSLVGRRLQHVSTTSGSAAAPQGCRCV